MTQRPELTVLSSLCCLSNLNTDKPLLPCMRLFCRGCLASTVTMLAAKARQYELPIQVAIEAFECNLLRSSSEHDKCDVGVSVPNISVQFDETCTWLSEDSASLGCHALFQSLLVLNEFTKPSHSQSLANFVANFHSQGISATID